MSKTKSGRRLKRTLTAKYRLPLYENFNLWLVVTPSLAKTVKYLFPDECEEGMDRWDGLAVYRGKDCFVVLNSQGEVELNAVTHELTHACQYFCDMLHIPVLPRNHEAYAYMIGHLNGVVYKKLKKWRIEIK